MRRLGIGILGCGFISQYHLNALASVEEAAVVAVCDRSEERARALAGTYEVPRVYSELESMLDDAEVEAVLILTPNHVHKEQTIEAVRRGRHVMVQKPFARSVSEGREMLAAARKAGVVLAPSFMHRFAVETRQAKRYIEEGAIGRPTSFHIRNGVMSSTWASWFYDADLTGGGAVIDVGVHGIDVVRYLLGGIAEASATLTTSTPTRVLADGSTVRLEAEDTAAITYVTESGTLVAHEVSWVQRMGAKRFSFEIYGDQGTIMVRSTLGPLAIASSVTGGIDTWFVPELPNEQFGQAQHRSFVRSCLGHEPVSPSAEDGIATLEVVEAVYRSAAAREPVRIGA